MKSNPLRKEVKIYNNRQQIHLNKSDDYHDDVVFIFSPDELQELSSEMESLRTELHNLKLSDDEKSNKIKGYELKQQLFKDEVSKEINQEYKSEIDNLKAEVSKQQQLIKEYQSDVKAYEDAVKEHADEVNDLKDIIHDIATSYNNLRIAIKGTSRLDVLLNRHKGLLNDYPEMMLSSKDITDININSEDDHHDE